MTGAIVEHSVGIAGLAVIIGYGWAIGAPVWVVIWTGFSWGVSVAFAFRRIRGE